MPRKGRQLAAQTKALLNEVVRNKKLALGDQRMIDLDERAEYGRAARAAAAHDEDAALLTDLFVHEVSVLQGGEISLIALDVVGQAENVALGDAGVFRRLRGKFLVRTQSALIILQQKWNLHLFEKPKLIHGVEAGGGSRISGGEDEVTFLGAAV